MQHGVLRKEARQFEMESEVRSEAVKVLGEELVSRNITREEFGIVARNHIDRFPEGGLMREWLETPI
jgi:hypothetical protein